MNTDGLNSSNSSWRTCSYDAVVVLTSFSQSESNQKHLLIDLPDQIFGTIVNEYLFDYEDDTNNKDDISESLELITTTQAKPTNHIKKLLQCFNRDLNAKLAANVTKLCLHDNWLFAYQIFPNLTELFIKFYDWDCIGFDIRLLPRKLQSLKLLYWQTDPFKKLNLLDLPRLDYLYIDVADRYGHTLANAFNLYDLVALPKRLTVLELYENFIEDDDLIHLPPNLILLYLPKNNLITNHGISLLPEYLKYLALTSNENVDCQAFADPKMFPTYLCYVWIPYVIYLQLFNRYGIEIEFCYKPVKFNPCWILNPKCLETVLF
jgi:Leucine-rich repeat (LRR) protein